MESLLQLADEYRSQFGEPEYRFFKKHIVWSKPRRERGCHIVPVGDGVEVTQEEFAENYQASEKAKADAFYGRLQASFWRYDRKMIKDGWRERLIKDVEMLR